MSELFDQTSIGSMNLANRFVRSATWEGLADQDGAVTPRLTEMMVELAKGEVRLIISGYSFVSHEGQSSPAQLGVPLFRHPVSRQRKIGVSKKNW